jgi:glucose-1-phosphate thymidylyltransferase
MKLLILAAGYATRLYPLTLNKAKPLLEVGGKPMIEHVLATTREISVEEVFVVTNNKFAADFEVWAKGFMRRDGAPRVTVLNDRSTSEQDRLGAIADIWFVIESANVRDDLMILGGDNLFDQKLDGFLKFARQRGATLGVYDVGDLELIKKYASVMLDETNRVVYFEEKPPQPKTTLSAMCLYYYPKEMLPMIQKYLAEGNNPDQPGRLVQWLYTRRPVYGFQIKGRWLDIGGPESYELANRQFRLN